MEINRTDSDLKQLLFCVILAVIAQGVLLFATTFNVIAIIACVILDILVLIVDLAEWSYFSKKIILSADGCTFVSGKTTKKFTWEELYVQRTKNDAFFFGSGEISCEGVIISGKPISRSERIGAMTYCRFTHPRISVFIRFSSPSVDEAIKKSGRLVYRGFVADKTEILDLLKTRKQEI